ncbi:MAG: PAS domain-containing protein, partial [Parvularculaceae bacterium]|nr:PAS domain-containing protein [Parvularculaceae bacterium]
MSESATKIDDRTQPVPDATPELATTAPRPPQPEDIVRLMDEAASRARTTPAERPPARLWHKASLALLWGGLSVVVAIAVYLAYALAGALGAAVAAALGVLSIGALGLVGGGIDLFSPLALAGLMRRRTSGDGKDRLAGGEVLDALGLAEKVLDADVDARLVTRRDGVVVYANAAYLALARAAGVSNRIGMPPRIDRLFAQHGAEATKLFRLCRAARSGVEAAEIVRQALVMEGGARRTFETSVRPVPGSSEHVVWRVRALEDGAAEPDGAAAAYADYPEPVLAVERSGQVAWANAALRERLGLDRNAPRALSDFVLGETAELLRALWRVDLAPQKARLRGPGGEPVDGVFTAFRRAGVGEGFVCVAASVEQPRVEEEASSLSGDMLEAPVGVAIVEGEIGREARIVEANKAFGDVFGGARKNAPLIRALPAAAVEELALEIRRKSPSGAPPRAVDCV